ncbi:antitoxin VbhA family protein [Kocuria rhizophila]|uniref:antitoxin VbhA family protein n=1 Tax=Kocuria TaxID=57493 RepID=UPI00214F61A1|nr:MULTISPECIES: antitoxin VbhA family protein [Kocuria]MCR4527033.1 antitoxin VbhA family protein [Kocuria rhizophila]MCT1545324.1 antitoxin VbhA family protein [Kocuria rhizophila]MCT2171114.1 antitoxin VbhA family protein [Kocuria rhizophila]MDN3463039.1 antitoxin VbhA family protein [Kocuria sp. APC 4018]
MTTYWDDDLHERRESMTDILASWDLEGALPDAAAMELIREYVAGAFGLDELIQKMAELPLYPEQAA